jgi:anti-sigma factor RsiW
LVRHARLGHLIDAYVDCELPPPRRDAVTAHLSECARCAAAVSLTRLVKRTLEDKPRRGPASLSEARLRRHVRRISADWDGGGK